MKDTLETLEQMKVDAFIVRHGASGAAHQVNMCLSPAYTVAVATGKQKIIPYQSTIFVLQVGLILFVLYVGYVQRAFAIGAVATYHINQGVAGLSPMSERRKVFAFVNRAQLLTISCRHQHPLLKKLTVGTVSRVVVVGQG